MSEVELSLVSQISSSRGSSILIPHQTVTSSGPFGGILRNGFVSYTRTDADTQYGGNVLSTYST